MADTFYKGHAIQSCSYQEQAQWLPLAVVFTKTPSGTHAHSITSQQAYPTQEEADTEAERLARQWIDLEEEPSGGAN